MKSGDYGLLSAFLKRSCYESISDPLRSCVFGRVYRMAHFDEKSGLVQCRTSWGTWGQTVDDVQIEVNVEKGTKSRDVKCTIQPKEIAVCPRRESL